MISRTFTCTAIAAVVGALSLACDVAPPELMGEDVASRGGEGSDPPLLNTWKLFTSSVANVDTLGEALDDVSLVRVELKMAGASADDYVPVDAGSLWAHNGELRAEVQGVPALGAQFVHSRWTFAIGSDEVVAHLTAVETAQDAGLWDPRSRDRRELDPQRLVYTFHYLSGHTRHATCGDDPAGGGRTVIYGDIFVDHETGDISPRKNSLYLACLDGAVGKAALWGYAPDSPSNDSVSLPAFNTATRIIRHDFCADGEHHTVVGKEVALRDRWIHEVFAPQYGAFTTEAVWEEGGGALCLNKIRATGEVLSEPYQCPDGSIIPLCPAEAPLGSSWDVGGYGDFWTKTAGTL